VLAVRVADDVFVLSESSAAELIGRVPRAPREGGEAVSGSLEEKLRDAVDLEEPAILDRGELAILGAVIESWATEMGVDAADVQDLRAAIAEHVG
jgi:hypothetical protein